MISRKTKINIQVIIFWGIMASLGGTMFGLATTEILQREQRKPILVVGWAK